MISISSFLFRPLWASVGLRSKGSKRARVEELKSGARKAARHSLAFLVVYCLFGCVVASAQTAAELIASKHVLIRAKVEPSQVFVGQKVTLSVDVMTKTWFLDAPLFPDVLDIEDAIVIPPGPFGINSSRVIDGERYAVQTKRYSIIPTGIGRFRVPSFGIRFVVAREDASRSPEIVLRTPELSYGARVPEAAQGLGLVVSTPRLEIQEKWSPTFDDLKVGDSLTRTVTTTIEDSAAMLVPVPEFLAPEGIGVYSQRPALKDERNRGEMRGSRVDRVVYSLESEGEFNLPEIVIHWWELGAGKLHREVLPGVHFEVETNPALVVETFGSETSPSEESEPREDDSFSLVDRIRPWLAAALILATSWWLFRLPIKATLRVWTEHRLKGSKEKERFRDFKDAARKGDAGSTIRALIAWLDTSKADREPSSLGAFAESSGDPVLTAQIEALESAVFAAVSADVSWNPSLLVKKVAAVRSRGSRTGPGGALVTALPALNPGSSSGRANRDDASSA